MVMANTDLQLPQSSLTPVQERAIELMGQGMAHTAIAKKLAKGDADKAKYWRKWLRDHRYKAAEEARAEVELKAIIGVVPATTALVKRAKRGRIDAIKLLFEMTGIHNTKVKHEHSGEIEIKMTGLARPRPVETVDNVVDAEVVEED